MIFLGHFAVCVEFAILVLEISVKSFDHLYVARLCSTVQFEPPRRCILANPFQFLVVTVSIFLCVGLILTPAFFMAWR